MERVLSFGRSGGLSTSAGCGNPFPRPLRATLWGRRGWDLHCSAEMEDGEAHRKKGGCRVAWRRRSAPRSPALVATVFCVLESRRGRRATRPPKSRPEYNLALIAVCPPVSSLTGNVSQCPAATGKPCHVAPRCLVVPKSPVYPPHCEAFADAMLVSVCCRWVARSLLRDEARTARRGAEGGHVVPRGAGASEHTSHPAHPATPRVGAGRGGPRGASTPRPPR